MADSSDKSRGVTLTLGIVLGFFGAHRFYAGKVGTGIAMVCTLGGCGIWWLYDCILISAGEFRDSEGRRISDWSPDPGRLSQPSGGQGGQRLLEVVEEVRSDVYELQERVDFMESMLAQVKEREGLPRGPAEPMT